MRNWRRWTAAGGEHVVMDPVDVRSTADAGTALAEAGDFLRARPVENNLVLTLLGQRVAKADHGRYWWAGRGGDVVGFALLSPRSFRAVVSPAGVEVVDALVECMAEEAPGLPELISDAATAAAFAGRWAERRRVPAFPVEGQRIYRLGALRHPTGVPGRLRRAWASERELLVTWAQGFLDASGPGPFDAGHITDHQLEERRLWMWERDGRPVSMAVASTPAAGVARIAFVYTPVEHRSQGYAAACVAALSARVLEGDADTCILYTQLSNPTSNAIYRRIGYEPMMEALIYRFG